MPSFFKLKNLTFGLIFYLITAFTQANELPTLRLATLKFGTANWEIDVIRHHQLDKKYGFKLKPIPLASKQAAVIALQGGAADMILTDWIWVSRQRNNGQALTFFPYSRGVGGLVIHPESDLRNISDLQGKKLGIAGGPIDRNWILIQSLAKKQYQINLDKEVKKVFGTPPLLYQKFLNGELDAVINFWHYVAKLEAKGMRTLISMSDTIKQLGFDDDTPMLGYVFHEAWASEFPSAVKGMMAASLEAKQILKHNDKEWDRLRPQMKANGEQEFLALREGFRNGIPSSQLVSDTTEAKALYELISSSMKQYTKKSSTLAEGTFYRPPENHRGQQ